MRGERRLVERVLLRWTKMAEGRRFPRLNEIDHWMVGEDWANCLLIAVQSPIELSHFTAVGKNLAVALCPEDTLAGVLLSHLPWVVSSRCCLIVEGGATLRSVPILYRGATAPAVRRSRRDRPRAGCGEPSRADSGRRADHASHSEALDLDRGFLPESHFSVVCAAGAVATLPEVIGGLGPDFIGSRNQVESRSIHLAEP
jgi:hypothetical protein